ncbi:DUF6392 family protein [Pseudomonas sp. 18175]|uniref:DUF6392 family protein n=1 Tax=Pseudomonas sp. 18175 TaxID=3390056 RepID=UPI003D1A443F
MNAAAINTWVKHLGRNHDDLVKEGVVPNQSLTPLLDHSENEEWVQYPAQGVELWFLKENKILEKILLTLVQTDDGCPAYCGSLPSPFERHMTQSSVRNQFGMPFKSLSSVTIPGSGGKKSGGWDAYGLHEDVHPRAHVGFSYSSDLTVETVAFALNDGELD